MSIQVQNVEIREKQVIFRLVKGCSHLLSCIRATCFLTSNFQAVTAMILRKKASAVVRQDPQQRIRVERFPQKAKDRNLAIRR